MKKLILIHLFLAGPPGPAFAQNTEKQSRFSLHVQQTIITQYKPEFSAPYTGQNSLITNQETQSSITSTLFGAARLWKGAEAFFNPEISGGAGLSRTLGVAGFPNGETFRVGGTQNKIYIARLYLKQRFEWGTEKDTLEDGFNQLGGVRSKRYFSFTLGKFGMADFFDGNNFSHDPRTKFMNWALMDNAAWDYPANTRGYVLGATAELGQPDWSLRFAFTLVTTQANQSVWDAKIDKANTETVEFEKRYAINGQKGTLRLLTFLNNGKFGNYKLALQGNQADPNVDNTQQYGRHKYGFGIND